MEFAEVVFYGRMGEQALSMFNIDLRDWQGARVLDCPGGPGSLSAVLRSGGVDVTAVDPLFRLNEEILKQTALADLDLAMKQLQHDPVIRPDFDLDACRQEHLDALEVFLADRRAHPCRYIAASLPELPFADLSFDLVLSGHLLFSYSSIADGGLMAGEGLDLEWHRRALHELLRVSRRSVRLYPAHTIERQARRHPFAESMLAELPCGWSGHFQSTTYDQGHDGLTELLVLNADQDKR